MCSFKVITVVGIIISCIAIIASLGTEGFYAWKVYEVGNECNTNSSAIDVAEPDVCVYNELEVRAYVGLAEGIFATAVSIVLLIGFASPSMALIWVWVIWALGIASYNAYCIKDYHDVIMSQDDTNSTSLPWADIVDVDYGIYFIVAMTSVIWYGAFLLVIIPMAAYLTHIIRTDGSYYGGYELSEW